MAYDKYVDIIKSAVEGAKELESDAKLGLYTEKMAKVLEKLASSIRSELAMDETKSERSSATRTQTKPISHQRTFSARDIPHPYGRRNERRRSDNIIDITRDNESLATQHF